MLPLRLLRTSLLRRGLSLPSHVSSLPRRFYATELPHIQEPWMSDVPPGAKPPPPKPPSDLPVFKDNPDIYSIAAEGKTEYLVTDKPIVAQVFEEHDFGLFEPVKVPPPEIPKRKRRTKAEREKEKLEAKPETQPHVPPHLQNPADAFRYRILMARIEGEDEMKKIEDEIEANFQKGENDKNKAAIESGLLQTQWKLRPLGFHSKWLYGLARKYSGDDFAVKYLLQSRKNLYNWYLFAPTRQICLWRDCVDDLITSCKPALEARKITLHDLLDVIAVYHVDTEERNQYTYLEDQITGYKPPHVSEKIKLLAEYLDDKYICDLYIRMVEDFQPTMKLMTEEQMLDLIQPAIKRLTEQEMARMSKAMDSDKALEIRHMPEVRKLFGLSPKPRPIPPPFVPPPEPAKDKVPSEF